MLVFVNLTFTDVLILTNKNATLRYLIMDNLLCSEERSVVGDTVSVCERNFQKITAVWRLSLQSPSVKK